MEISITSYCLPLLLRARLSTQKAYRLCSHGKVYKVLPAYGYIAEYAHLLEHSHGCVGAWAVPRRC